MRMSLESSPPISMTVLACGYRAATEEDWATISLTKQPPISSAASLPPVPVMATRPIDSSGCLLSTSASTWCRAWKGRPWQ